MPWRSLRFADLFVIFTWYDLNQENAVETQKLDVPNSVNYLNQIPIFEWYGVWFGSKNRYQIDMGLKEVGPHAQNVITMPGSITILIGETHMTIDEHKNLHFENV